MIAEQWAGAEFSALCQFHLAGVRVPYPVQVLGTEVLLEFIGTADGTAAPRLAECAAAWRRPGRIVASARAVDGHTRAPWRGSRRSIGLQPAGARRSARPDRYPAVVDVGSPIRAGPSLDRDAANVGNWFDGAWPGPDGGEPGPGRAGRICAPRHGSGDQRRGVVLRSRFAHPAYARHLAQRVS